MTDNSKTTTTNCCPYCDMATCTCRKKSKTTICSICGTVVLPGDTHCHPDGPDEKGVTTKTTSFWDAPISADFVAKFSNFKDDELDNLATDFVRMTLGYSTEEQIYINRLAKERHNAKN